MVKITYSDKQRVYMASNTFGGNVPPQKPASLRSIAELAYSEMAFTIHDLMSGRVSQEQIEYRTKRLAHVADDLRDALDRS